MSIDEINKKTKHLNKIKKLLRLPINDADTIEDKIFKKYLELENVSKVANYINGLGYKNNNRKYIANDISDVITNKNTNIKNKELQKEVINLFHSHKKGIKRIKW